MGRAIGVGFVVVVTYSISHRIWPILYWVEFALLVALVVGIGAVVGYGSGEQPFLTAAAAAFITMLCIVSIALFTGPGWARPHIMPSVGIVIMGMALLSLIIGAMTGGVALGLRSLRASLRTGR